MSESDGVALNLAARLRSGCNGWSDSPVEVRERRAMFNPSIGLSVEVRDVGVGHVEIATDADAEVTVEYIN